MSVKSVHFLDLPRDMHVEILARIPPSCMNSVLLTCRQLSELFQDETNWRAFYQRDFKTLEKPKGSSTYHAAYRWMHRVRSNLLSEFYSTSFISHETTDLSGEYMPFIGTVDNKLFRGGFGNPIEVWNLETEQKLDWFQDMREEFEPAWVFGAEQDELIVQEAEEGGKIKRFSLRDGALIGSFEGPAGAQCMLFCRDRLFAGLENGSIEIWDYKAEEKLQSFLGHSQAVTRIALHDAVLISGTSEGEFKIWDIAKRMVLDEFYVDQPIIAFYINDSMLFFGFAKGEIRGMKLTEENKAEKALTFKGHRKQVVSLTSASFGEQKMLLSLSEDKTIRVWDLESGNCLKTLDMSSVSPWSIVFFDGMLICSNVSFTITKHDFAADDLSILETMAEDFKTADFERLPKMTKKRIKEKLLDAMKIPLETRSRFDAGSLSLDGLWECSKTEKKVSAIREYIAERKQLEKK